MVQVIWVQLKGQLGRSFLRVVAWPVAIPTKGGSINFME